MGNANLCSVVVLKRCGRGPRSALLSSAELRKGIDHMHQDFHVIDAVSAYDALAPYYKAISSARGAYLEAVERIVIEHARGAKSLLDIGAGDAVRTCVIAEEASVPHVVAVEPSSVMRMQCRKKIELWNCRAADIPETDLRFNVILCLWNVLGHVSTAKERLRTLRRARELLAPAGMIFVDVNNRYNAVAHGWGRACWNMLHDYFLWAETNGDVVISWTVGGGRSVCTHGHLFTRRELESLFQRADLSIRREWFLNYRNGAICKSSLHGSLLYQLEATQRGAISFASGDMPSAPI